MTMIQKPRTAQAIPYIEYELNNQGDYYELNISDKGKWEDGEEDSILGVGYIQLIDKQKNENINGSWLDYEHIGIYTSERDSVNIHIKLPWGFLPKDKPIIAKINGKEETKVAYFPHYYYSSQKHNRTLQSVSLDPNKEGLGLFNKIYPAEVDWFESQLQYIYNYILDENPQWRYYRKTIDNKKMQGLYLPNLSIPNSHFMWIKKYGSKKKNPPLIYDLHVMSPETKGIHQNENMLSEDGVMCKVMDKFKLFGLKKYKFFNIINKIAEHAFSNAQEFPYSYSYLTY